MDFILILAIFIFIVVALSIADLGLGLHGMTRLSRVAPLREEAAPRVSIVVPARNEEADLEPAIHTMLQQDYRNLEIIAVDDRSEDGTGRMLEQLVQRYPDRLRVFHLDELPPGWMGKNHALAFGAERAEGEYLLFTDADIHLEQTTISRAIAHMRRENLDHLTLLFRNTSPGLILNSLILDAGTGLLQCFRPWRARTGSTRYYMGIGAFNLVRRAAYDGVGGFTTIRMHPVDDIMLGKIIKGKGFRQECLLGYGLVDVPWYGSVGQMVDGLSKNALALIGYRFLLVPPLLAVLFLLNIFPLWGLVLFDSPARVVFGLTVLLKTAAYYGGTRILGISPWCALGTLVSPYLVFHIYLKAAWRNARDRGIYWRGTYYSLAELRNNDKLLF